MKKLLGSLGGLIILLVAFHFFAVESGEVATVWTEAASGSEEATRLWVVNHDGRLWLAAGNDEATWLKRIQAKPEVRVEYRGDTSDFTAVPTPEARQQILDLMSRKYGWADTWVRTIVGLESIPVRLEPR